MAHEYLQDESAATRASSLPTGSPRNVDRPEQNAAEESTLRRVIDTRALAATAFNVTVGGGIFVLPAVVAASVGPSAPLAYVVCAIAMGLIVLCFAQAGSRVTLTGGPYAYVEIAF